MDERIQEMQNESGRGFFEEGFENVQTSVSQDFQWQGPGPQDSHGLRTTGEFISISKYPCLIYMETSPVL